MKRLGPSGLRLGGNDLADVLQRAYAPRSRDPTRLAEVLQVGADVPGGSHGRPTGSS